MQKELNNPVYEKNIQSFIEAVELYKDEFGIDSVISRSSTGMSRARVEFKNGISLSVINGMGSYGSENGLYEIAIFRGEDYANDLFLSRHGGDDVIGYLRPREILEYILHINKVGNQNGN